MKKYIAVIIAGLVLLAACTPLSRPVVLEHSDGESPVITETVIPFDEPPAEPEPEPEQVLPALSPKPGNAGEPGEINSRAVFMYNLETDTVVYARNEHMKLPPASIAKIMTCLVIMENIPDLNAFVQVTDAAFAPFESGDPNMEDAATAGIEPGQSNVTYLDCIFGLMLPSGCEAANILAYNGGGGDMDAFAEMMNAKARELGAVNSNFTNASGLYEDGFYTTAYDMFLITKYAMEKYPLFMEIAGFSSYIMPPNERFPNGYRIPNANEGLLALFEFGYATGIKIGSIYEYFVDGIMLDGFLTFVSYAEKDGMSLLTVTLGAEYYDEERKWSGNHYYDHFALYEWAFGTFEIN
jgi:D-alanyl-D-alanine carboxypeptidase (penicillin-binding protein 5/6)